MFTLDYFIEKFKSIPDNRWNVGHQIGSDGTHCALGHCGESFGTEQVALSDVLESIYVKVIKKVTNNNYDVGDIFNNSCFDKVAAINNGETEQYQQSTPKERILAALYDVKKMQQPKYEDVTKELAILPISETSDIVKEVKVCQ